MKPSADQPKAPESKPGAKPDAKDDLKSLPCRKWKKNFSRLRTASAMQRRRSGWRNTVLTKSRSGRPIHS